MKNWPFRYQIILISTIPAILVWLAMTASNLYLTSETLHQAHARHGETLARQIAPSCEFAIFSGDMEPLEQILEKIVDTSDIEWIEVYDTEYHLLAHAGSPPTTANSEIGVFSAPIDSTILAIDDYSTMERDPPATVGTISIGVTAEPIRQLQGDLLLRSLWIGISILILIVLSAVAISRGLTSIFQRIRRSMGRIAHGDFSPPDGDLPDQGELGELVDDLHKMAQSLERNRKQALAAYEELEIKSRENEQLLQNGRPE